MGVVTDKVNAQNTNGPAVGGPAAGFDPLSLAAGCPSAGTKELARSVEAERSWLPSCPAPSEPWRRRVRAVRPTGSLEPWNWPVGQSRGAGGPEPVGSRPELRRSCWVPVRNGTSAARGGGVRRPPSGASCVCACMHACVAFRLHRPFGLRRSAHA